MTNNFTNIFNQIKDILSKNDNLDFEDNHLPTFLNNQINTPMGDVGDIFISKKSKYPDKLISLKLLEELVNKLSKNKSIVRLSHIGFCYKVSSLKDESERLINLAKKSEVTLYQEESNDDGLWFFIGDVENWKDPTIELIPIESTDDKYIDYWLPHIQIDIDTKLTGKEIEDIVKSVFVKEIIPFPIKIDGTTYIIRNRLGVIDGVNIFLDLATNARKVKYLKQELWKKIV